MNPLTPEEERQAEIAKSIRNRYNTLVNQALIDTGLDNTSNNRKIVGKMISVGYRK